MTGVPMSIKRAMCAAVVAATAALSGCASDGLELNGKIFDWIGVSESAQAANKREAKLSERSGLIVPPNLARLPEPGSEQPQDANFNLNDPDQKRIATAANREREHKAYCSGEKNWQERALNKNAEAARSPYGPCNQFIGDAFQPANTGTQTKR